MIMKLAGKNSPVYIEMFKDTTHEDGFMFEMKIFIAYFWLIFCSSRYNRNTFKGYR